MFMACSVFKRQIVVFALLLLMSSNLWANYDGVWAFRFHSLSLTQNGQTQTFDENYFRQLVGQETAYYDDMPYDSSWLEPQVQEYTFEGFTTRVSTSYEFLSAANGKRLIHYTGQGPNINFSYILEQNMIRVGDSAAPSASSQRPITTAIVDIPVTAVQGTVYSVTPTELGLLNDKASSNSTILTSQGASASFAQSFGQISLKQNSLVTFTPQVSLNNLRQEGVNMLRGAMDFNLNNIAANSAFEVKTPVVSFKVKNTTNKRASQNANFSINYDQNGLIGQSTINVNSGSVEVVDRQGNTLTLGPGQQQSFSNQVQRSTWVQPADSAFLYGGKVNTLAWADYPGAHTYSIEFTFPNPSFAEENPASFEFSQQQVRLNPGDFNRIEGLAIMELPLPANLNGLTVEARIYPLDAAGNILPGSLASDKGTFGFKP